MTGFKIRNEFQAGVFILVALILFGFSIWTLGRERQIFAKQASFSTSFTDVKGLSAGAPVRLGGISIGRVNRISFSSDPLDPRVHVDLLVNEGFLDRVRSDAVISIETQGLLGDRFLNMSLGKGQPLAPGSEITSQDLGDLSEIFRKASLVVDQTVEVANKVNSFVGKLDSTTVADLNETIRHLKEILNEVENGKGPLHELIYSAPAPGAPTLMNKLQKAADNILKVTEALANGGGTLGALLVDSQLYDNLVEVTDGAKRSIILRQAIRSSLKEEKEKKKAE